jgi:1-deoxy-D-xylulose-5-phosphate reductoisomerase
MDGKLKGISVLGSTGSVGTQTLDIVRKFPNQLKITGLAANHSHVKLAQQIHEFSPTVAHWNQTATEHRDLTESNILNTTISKVATVPDADIVVTATTGIVSMEATFDAISEGKDIALANKESLLIAGNKLMEHASLNRSKILPIDSEPSAIWQCLAGESSGIGKILLTASGGSLRTVPISKLPDVKLKETLQHPNWNMGAKITVDSATMMNKAFEVIEAKWLFNVSWEDIEVVIHPQSIIHSMVEFRDGSTKAQMSGPDMRLPIQYALFYPERMPNNEIPRFDPKIHSNLTFEDIDNDRYPCFKLALNLAQKGDTWPALLVGADEAAVNQFIAGKIGFTEIAPLIEAVSLSHNPIKNPSLKEMVLSVAQSYSKVMELTN